MSSNDKSLNNYLCSFCAKPQGDVGRLIAGPNGVFICDECILLCDQMISEDLSPDIQEDTLDSKLDSLTPKDIFKKLDEYTIGQNTAKKILSVGVYNHYKRVYSKVDVQDVELQKSNILLAGPSGSGKTYLAQNLAKILDVPFSIVDATSLTEAGYVGEDVENILLRLIQAADYDISKAEKGIIYIDEIDKIARKSSNPSITRDVSGEGVQQALLKIIEGCLANIPPQGGRKHPHQEFLNIRTDDILFICGGAFEDLGEIIERRVFKNSQSIGFSQGSITNRLNGSNKNDLFRHVNYDDLLNYGFIPEFIGRFPIITSLSQLCREDLIKVLTEPKNAIVKQYQKLFEIENVELTFSNAALELISEQALTYNTGARALRSIIEQSLIDVMYELPSFKNVLKCNVDVDDSSVNTKVTLLSQNGVNLFTYSSDQKTA